MDGTSAADTSDARGAMSQPLPACVASRAAELLDLAVLKLLALCLGATVAFQLLALLIALLSPPALHYIPEVAP